MNCVSKAELEHINGFKKGPRSLSLLGKISLNEQKTEALEKNFRNVSLYLCTIQFFLRAAAIFKNLILDRATSVRPTLIPGN